MYFCLRSRLFVSGIGAGAGAENGGSGAGVGDTGSKAEGRRLGGGGFRAGDEGLRLLDGLSTSEGIQNKFSRPLLLSSSISSGLDSRPGNPNISRRVGRSSRLGKNALFSGPLSGLADIVRGITALTVMVVPP
jgi:hypothetical protein